MCYINLRFTYLLTYLLTLCDIAALLTSLLLLSRRDALRDAWLVNSRWDGTNSRWCRSSLWCGCWWWQQRTTSHIIIIIIINSSLPSSLSVSAVSRRVIQCTRGFLNDMRYINSRFTYLLTYLLIYLPVSSSNDVNQSHVTRDTVQWQRSKVSFSNHETSSITHLLLLIYSPAPPSPRPRCIAPPRSRVWLT